MSEAKFTAEFKKSIKKLYPDAIYQKHSDRFTRGIADVEVVYYGMTYWFELKDRTGKGGKLVGQASHQLEPLQVKFLTDRIKAGIEVYGLIKLDNDTAAMITGDFLTIDDVLTHDEFHIKKENGVWQIDLSFLT